MRIKADEFEKEILRAGLRVEYTPHGLPVLAKAARDRFAALFTRKFVILFLILGFFFVFAFLIGLPSIIPKGHPAEDWSDLGELLVILAFVVVIVFLMRGSKREVLETDYITRNYHEVLLSSLPEAPSDAWVEGLEHVGTSVLHVRLPSYRDVEFTFSYERIQQSIEMTSVERWGYCMRAKLPARTSDEGVILLFVKELPRQKSPLLRTLQERFNSDPAFSEKPSWAFGLQKLVGGLSASTYQKAYSAKFEKGNATVCITVRESSFKGLNQKDTSDAFSRLLKAIEILKKSGAAA